MFTRKHTSEGTLELDLETVLNGVPCWQLDAIPPPSWN
jgi:hypothetical protein